MADEVTTTTENQSTPSTGTLREIAALFLRMGFTAFGGPAAHIAMFRDEVVTRRQWITDQHFLDLLGATNLIPGPNSTEMAIHIGYTRGGWRGLIVAGVCFIGPAALIVLALAVLYVQYGTTPAATWLLYGIKPVIIAVILQAIYGLLWTAIKNRLLAGLGLAAFILYLAGIHELALMSGGAAAYLLIVRTTQARGAVSASALPLLALGLPLAAQVAAAAVPVSLGLLFLNFLKIGAVLYGSGYVLLAFLRTDFVEWLGWLTNQQLLDAVAIGQFTPGPVFTTATFIGYLVADVPGAALATLGIFLPSFIFVLLVNPLIPRLRASQVFSLLLDSVNVVSLGLMAGVTVQLGREALIDPLTVALALAAGGLLIRFKVNSTWLILGGGLAGLLYALATGVLASG